MASEQQREKRRSGVWVALSEPRFDREERRVVDGRVVDSDENLSSLLERVQDAGLKNCAIHFVE